MQHPFVGSAIPVAYGDNYKGYRIVGTALNYFDRHNASIDQAAFDKPFEVVVGSAVRVRN